MRYLKTYSQLNETKTELKSKKDFEVSYHYDDEKEAKKDLTSMGYRFKGYIVSDGHEHIWIEQWEKESNDSPIARLIWLNNITLKAKPDQVLPTMLNGAQVTIIEPQHPNFKEAKEMKFGGNSKNYPAK